MSLATTGISYTISQRLSGATEDCSIVRGRQLRTLCHQRCCNYGQKTTGQKTTIVEILWCALLEFIMNFVLSKKWRKVPVILASAQTDMFVAEYRSDNSSGLNCGVIKIQHQMERLCLNRNLIGLQPTAVITTQHHNLVRCSSVSLSTNQTRYFGTLCRVVLTESEHQSNGTSEAE